MSEKLRQALRELISTSITLHAVESAQAGESVVVTWKIINAMHLQHSRKP